MHLLMKEDIQFFWEYPGQQVLSGRRGCLRAAEYRPGRIWDDVGG